MRICRRLLTATAGPGYYSLRTDAVELRLWFLTDTILRIRAGFDGDWAERSYTLLRTAWPDAMDSLLAGQRQRVEPAPASLSEEPDRFVLTGAKLRVEIEKEPFRLLIYDAAGNLLHADIPDIGYHEDSNRRRIHTSEMAPEDAFYGFGEKTGPLDKRLAFMTMDPGDALGYNPLHSDPLYKHIPFYIKMNRRTRGAVGYFYHNTAICDFDMGRQHSNYWAPHTRYRTEAGDIDLFFIAGPAITDVIAGYTFLTGTSAMLPKYALGYLGSSMYYAELPKDCDSAIEQFVDTARSYGFPIDGFQLSSGYTTYAGKRCVFTWNKDRFPDPPAFFQALRERGVEVSPNVKPALLLMHPLLPALQENDIFVRDPVQEKPSVGAWWGGRGVFVDFTDPHARTVWKALLQEHVLEKGTTSVWNDNCEYEGVYDKDARVCLEGAGGTVGGRAQRDEQPDVSGDRRSNPGNKPGGAALHCLPGRPCRHPAAGPDLGGRQLYKLGLPARQYCYHPGDGAVRRGQPRLRHRRVLWSAAGTRTACALGAKRHLPTAFFDPFHKHRQHGYRTLDVSRLHRSDPGSHPPAVPAVPIPVYTDGLCAQDRFADLAGDGLRLPE